MKKKGMIAGLAAAAALVLLGSSLVVTYPNEYKLIRQFGEIVRVEENPGVSLKVPFIQNSSSIPKALQIYDIPQSDVITKDKKSMIADAFVLWKISDPVLFTRHLNGQVAQAQSRISASVFSSWGRKSISTCREWSISEKTGIPDIEMPFFLISPARLLSVPFC